MSESFKAFFCLYCLHEEDRVLEVYSIPLPLDSPTLCNTAYELAYSFELQNGCLFHRVSLHGDYLASSVLDQPFHIGGRSSQVLIANWKTQQQITIEPRSVDVSN